MGKVKKIYKGLKLSKWIVIDGYCATLVIEGNDSSIIENRVAFIEKTPRVFNGEEWIYGDKGSYGAHTDNHEELEQYGFDKESRNWCENKLRSMGAVIQAKGDK